jgi:hypothetical protein
VLSTTPPPPFSTCFEHFDLENFGVFDLQHFASGTRS